MAHPYELRARSAKSLLQRLYGELATLAREETELVRLEVVERAPVATLAGRTAMVGLICGTLAIACISTAAIAGIATAVPLWGAALIVGAVLTVVALASWASARRTIERLVEPMSGGGLAEQRVRVNWTRRQIDHTMSALEGKTDLLAPLKDTALGLGSLGVAVSAIVRDQAPDRPLTRS